MVMDPEKRRRREEKRRRRDERRRRKARTRFTRESPLELSGTIDVYETRTSSLRHLRGPLRGLIEVIPTEPASSRGRKAAQELRVVGIIAGGVIAIVGGTLNSALAGCIILSVSAALPMWQSTKMLWLGRIEQLGQHRRLTNTAPVAIEFNGRGVSVVGDDVKRRVLTHENTYELSLYRARSGVALVLTPIKKKTKRSAQLCFLVSDSSGLPLDTATLEPLVLEPDLPVAIDVPTLLSLYEAVRPEGTEPMGLA